MSIVKQRIELEKPLIREARNGEITRLDRKLRAKTEVNDVEAWSKRRQGAHFQDGQVPINWVNGAELARVVRVNSNEKDLVTTTIGERGKGIRERLRDFLYGEPTSQVEAALSFDRPDGEPDDEIVIGSDGAIKGNIVLPENGFVQVTPGGKNVDIKIIVAN